MLFVDREEELVWLHRGLESGTPQFRILYGRRRVGKSRLLDKFAEGARKIVYQSVEGTTVDQLRDLTIAVLECEDDPVLRAAPLANWDQALATFSRMAQSGPLLVILDEYQYAAEADTSLASKLQRWWSREAVTLPIYLILCGSYVRFFVQNVLTGPAYGRNTGSWQLRPLGYRQAAAFLSDWSHEDQIRAYAITGGIPHYILQFDPARSLAWNITHNVLSRGAVLYQEAELLLREELREPRLYFSILRAIADGCTRVSDITARVGARSDLTPYLRTLESLDLVAYRAPLVGKSRRGIWTIADPYLRFWFHFVLPHKVQLEHGASPERVYREAVAPQLEHFVSKPTFEDVCRSWVVSQANANAIPGIGEVGAWWGPVPKPTPENPRNHIEGEIEVVAVNGKRLVLAGEAKWTREPIGLAVLRHLREVVTHVSGVDENTQLFLFGREFDPRLVTTAEAEGVRLVTVDDLYAADEPCC